MTNDDQPPEYYIVIGGVQLMRAAEKRVRQKWPDVQVTTLPPQNEENPTRVAVIHSPQVDPNELNIQPSDSRYTPLSTFITSLEEQTLLPPKGVDSIHPKSPKDSAKENKK